MKIKFRQEILKKRKLLSGMEVKKRSEQIINNLTKLSEYKKARSVLFYVSFNNEVETHDIIKRTLENKDKQIIVPFFKDDKGISLSILKDFSDLVEKKFGILEPRPEKIIELRKDRFDLVIIPGIVFDKEGYRIGYGNGYYDRFLSGLKTLKVGLCYDFQLVEKIPKEKHDIPVDMIITEKVVIKF